MYLPSRISPKHIGLFALFLFCLILPFRDTVEYLFVSFTRKLAITPRGFSRQIQDLKKENLEFLLKCREMEQLKEKNEVLRKALNFKTSSGIGLLGAEIISFDPSSWRRVVTVNVGQKQGVRKGFYAVDNDGWFVGKIVDVSENFSLLRLTNDTGFNLPVFVGRNCLGLLKGGLNEVKILYIEEGSEIQVRDKVWIKTSAMQSPIYIGEIKKISKNPNDIFMDVSVALFSDTPFSYNIYIVQ